MPAGGILFPFFDPGAGVLHWKAVPGAGIFKEKISDPWVSLGADGNRSNWYLHYRFESRRCRFTYHIFSYNFELLKYCLPAFHSWFIIFHYIILYFVLFSLIWVSLEKILLFLNYFCFIFSKKVCWAKTLEEFQSKTKSNQLSHLK